MFCRDTNKHPSIIERITLDHGKSDFPSKNSLTLTPFTHSTSEARELIIRRNSELIDRNLHISEQFRTIHGHESDRQVEEIFVENYYLAVSYLHCNVIVTTMRLICYMIGWQTGAKCTITIDDFIQRFNEEASKDITETYRSYIRPDDFSYDCSKIVLHRTSQTKIGLYKIGAAASRVLARYFAHPAMTAAFDFIGTFFQSSTAVWFALITEPSLDNILATEPPSSEIAIGNIVLAVAKHACERSVNATNKKNTTRRPETRPDNEEDDDVVYENRHVVQEEQNSMIFETNEN